MTLTDEQFDSGLGLLEMFSDAHVLLHGAAGEDAMNVGDVLGFVRELRRLTAMFRAATEVQGDAEVLRYVTSGNAIPVTRCTVSADLIRQLVTGRTAVPEGVQWKERFVWLWRRASDGFGTPEGWWLHDGDDPTDEDLRRLDEWIRDSSTPQLSEPSDG
jgi:hypothetical protein